MFFDKSVVVLAIALVAVVVVEARTSPSSGGSSGGISVRDVTKDVIQLHNSLRNKHSAKPMSVNNDASNNAIRRARTVAQQGQLQHESGSKYGENLAWSSDPDASLEDMVQSWYDEIKDYDFNNPGFSGSTGHFTQLVWKASRGLGCALAQKTSGGMPGAYLACNYSPPGNYEGQYEENVTEN